MNTSQLAVMIRNELLRGTAYASIAGMLAAYDSATVLAALDAANAPAALRKLITSSGCGGACSGNAPASACNVPGGLPQGFELPPAAGDCQSPCADLKALPIRALLGQVTIAAASTSTVKFQPSQKARLLGVEILDATAIDDLFILNWQNSDGGQLYDRWSDDASSALQPAAVEVPGKYYVAQGPSEFSSLLDNPGRNYMPPAIQGMWLNQGGQYVSADFKSVTAAATNVIKYRAIWQYHR